MRLEKDRVRKLAFQRGLLQYLTLVCAREGPQPVKAALDSYREGCVS